MIKAIIIDDEQHCIDRLSRLLAQYCEQTVRVAGHYSTVEDGLNGIKLMQPQLLFLDVQIHDKTGFDLLHLLPEKKFEIIFTTAYEKYAVQAFRFSAVDYLLKPIDPGDLVQAVSKLSSKNLPNDFSRKVESLLENIDQLKQYTPPKKIMVPTLNGFELLPIIDIIRCQSDINYTTIFIKDKQKLVVARTLKEFEEMLEEYNFFRIHNSHLVNLAYVKSYNKGKGGSVTMIDNSQIEVSTRRKDDFLKRLSRM
ncbi:MAG: LytTR family DNA-binding domain-containing protein [Chitinophagaceae bacterium]